MISDQPEQQAHVAETLYFSMFPTEGTDEFRRFLLYVVYTTVLEDDGITVNKLMWKLNREFSLKPDDIEIAINALSNQKLFNAISKFHVKGRRQRELGREIIHLRARKEQQEVIEVWVANLMVSFPEYKNITSTM